MEASKRLPRTVTVYRPDISDELEDLVLTCLIKDPHRRSRDLVSLEQHLVEIYRRVVGEPYFREIPAELTLRADDHNNRGVSFLDLGKTDEAHRHFKEALDFDPQHPDASYNLALFQWKTGVIADDEMVETVRLTALVQVEAKYHLGLCHITRHDMEAAKRVFEEVVTHSSGHGAAYKYLAISLLGLSFYQEAKEAFERAIRLLPNDPECIRLNALTQSLATQSKSLSLVAPCLAYKDMDLPSLSENSNLIGVDFEQGTAITQMGEGIFVEVDLRSATWKNEYRLPDLRYSQFKYLGAGLILGYHKYDEEIAKGQIWDLHSRRLVSTIPLPPTPVAISTLAVMRLEKLYCLGDHTIR